MAWRPHVLLIAPRGESIRNFVYSDTLPALYRSCETTLLTVVEDDHVLGRFKPLIDHIVGLQAHPDPALVSYFRRFVDLAHFRWLWSQVAKNVWEWRDWQADTPRKKLRRAILKAAVRTAANRPFVEVLAAMERVLSSTFGATDYFDQLFRTRRPSLVFNTSHVHGPAADEPVRAARRLGIPTATFIFSWDNLTSRSRIFPPYNYFLVWHDGMRRQLLDIYRAIPPESVFVTGTPQFDFHFRPEYRLGREELCRRVGLDPRRPFVLYTAGIDHHFKEEHRHVEFIARVLQRIDIKPKPQLLVRVYAKGTSPEMRALATRNLPGVVFPPVLWDEKWATPLHEDLAIYTSLLEHTSMGINAASTVSLELMMHDKPVMNIGFNPPGSLLAYHDRWIRHIEFDHYRPVAESGAVMVAKSDSDVTAMLERGLRNSGADRDRRKNFLREMFGETLDGRAGARVAKVLMELAERDQPPAAGRV
jgi:hypothetical protein